MGHVSNSGLAAFSILLQPLCARKVVAGPRLMGEKSVSPGKLGVYGWVVIRVVIQSGCLRHRIPQESWYIAGARGTARIRVQQLAAREVAIACPKHGRLTPPRRDRLASAISTLLRL